MLNMENAEEVMQILERFTRLKQKEIPKELDDYMHYVAKTGDTVFKWSSLKYLFREKLLNVIKNFHDTSPRVDDLPQYPNVDPFNYESMKSSLLERLELFNAAPFTVQRLCELLTEPRKQYSRIDKFMRALEKNILVVSTIEPGRKQTESENGDSLDSVVNGDVSLDVNVDIEMENETIFNAADAPSNATPSETTPAQPSSNLIHKSDDDILPHPKKAKLDLDENNDAETEAATKSITTSKPEPTIPSVEVAMAEETTEKKQNEEPVSEDKPAAVKKVVEPTKKDSKDAEIEKMEEDLPASVPITETKLEVKSDLKESEKKPEEKDVTPIPASTALVAKEDPEQPKIAEETVDSTEKHVKKPEKESADKKEDSSQEEIIEKTKEVTEKEHTNNGEVQNGDVKSSELKTETNITTIKATNDKQSEMAVEETVAAASENKTEDIVKNENKEPAEAPVTISAVEKEVEAETAAPPAAQKEAKAVDVKLVDEAMAVSEEDSKPVEETKAPVVEKSTVKEADTDVKVNTATESPQNKTVAKEDEVKSTEVKEKETDKPEVADTPAVEAPTAVTPAVAKPTVDKVVETASVEATPAEATQEAEKAAVEKAIAEKPAVEKAIVEKAAVEKVAVEEAAVESDVEKAEPEKEAAEKPAAEKPEVVMAEIVTPTIVDKPAVIPPSDESPATAESKDTKPNDATPAPVTTPAELASTEIPAVAVEPVITADQPMEEHPESIAEAEPVVPAIVNEAAATVEEVLMGDSVAMATDAIEPANDEPAGMEVDDTSQEAMDQ